MLVFTLPASEVAFDRSVWGTVEEYGDARLERCRAFLPVPGVFADCSACGILGCYCCFAGLLALSFGY